MGSPRAQSESVGVILLAAVVITVTTIGGVVVLGNVADDADSASDPLVDFDVELTANDVTVTHAGGDVVAESDLTVIARGDTTTERYGFDAANVTGDGDGQFEPSERFRRDHDLTGTTVEVAVVHDASNTVLARESLTVGEPGEQLPPTARFSASPDDPDPGETVTFDASSSDDNDGTISAYRWEFGDGTTATTAGPTVDHTYSSEANYTVNLTVEDDDGATDTASETYWVTPLRAPENLGETANGLDYEYYEGTYTSLPDFGAETPVRTGVVSNFDISVRERDRNFAFRYTGYVKVPENGEYTFYTDSDDGSRLYIGEERVVDNPGLHAAQERSGTIQLRSGYHPITVTFFEHTGAETLDVRWNGPGIASKEAIPDDRLYRDPSPTARFDDSCVGLGCTFDASASTAPGSSIDSYRWNVSGDVRTTSDATLDYEFDSQGTYDVNLTVTTTDGKTARRNRTVTVEPLRAADDPGGLTENISYEYYEADDEFTSIPDYENLTPVRTGVTDRIDLDPSFRSRDFAFVYTGYLEVPRNDSYTLYTESDDGSRLYIGDERVVDNPGLHGAEEESGTIGLTEGRHEITVVMFEHTGYQVLDVRWSSPNISKGTIPADAFYRTPGPAASVTAECDALNCTFDASGSSSGSGSIASYEWVFGDGTTNTTTAPTTTHNYSSEGSYDVELTVVDGEGRTDTVAKTVTAVKPRPAANPSDTTAGLAYSYYEADPLDDRSDLQPSAIVRNGTTDQFDLDPAHREENFGFRYTGYVEVPETGNYTFYTTSDDGSRLSIGDELVVQNDGIHPARTRSGEIALEAGKHPITVTYFEHTIDDSLVVEYEGPGVSRQEIPAGALSRDVETTRVETVADWDGATTSEGVVHDGTGDRVADRLQLGYPTVDTGGSNLTGYWTLDEDSGSTAIDASESGYDGTVEGATLGDGGILDTTAYGFEDAWVEVGSFPNLDDDITISAWIYTTDNTESGQRIFADDENDNGGYALSLADTGNTGALRFYSRGVDPVSLDTGNIIENNRWYHVTAVANTTTNERRIYVNGTLEASDTYSGTWGTDGGAATIGGETRDGESGNRFNGRIDEVRVYNRSLSDSEVDTLDRTGRNGTLTTGTGTLTYEVPPSELSLRNVSATRPAGTTVNVTVLSDPDGDGTFQERADTITLDGSSSYDVTGLTGDSRRYRLEVELNTSSPTATPTVDRLELSG